MSGAFTGGQAHASVSVRVEAGHRGGAESLATVAVAYAAGDLSRQEPIEVAVELGKPGQHAFVPNKLRFETGKLYKLVLQEPEQRTALLHLARLHPAHLHAQGPGGAGRATARR